MKVKIRKGDTVEVIAGRDKYKRGEVIKVLPNERRVVVQGVNIRKKHQSEIQAQGRNLQPGIIEFEGPIDISNVMLVCPSCDEPTRVKIQREVDRVARICKKCGAEIA
ncbi:MAG TPA: 50S ribosomal protein L24 [Chloroflexi bacterium]|nr:50S ribosomal protein L24 [Chloroflexota bacterium]